MPHLDPPPWVPRARDLADSVAFLTRIPAPAGPPRGGAGAWAWPLVGAGLGLLAGLPLAAALALGLGPGVAAALSLAALAALTGALHEDGLADCADGFWGGRTREGRLEIMRDSRVGSYGVLALVLATLLRWSAIAALAAGGAPWGTPWGTPWGALAAAGALGRWAPVLLLAALPPARPSGLGAAAGRPQGPTVALAGAVALAAALLGAGGAGLVAGVAAVGATALWGLVARAKIGGQTGDACGAGVILAEIAALLALLAMR